METEARLVGDCLDSEMTARIEDVRARLGGMKNPGAAIDASTPEVGANPQRGKVSPIPAQGGGKAGNVISVRFGKRRAKPHAFRRCKVLRFPNVTERVHAATSEAI